MEKINLKNGLILASAMIVLAFVFVPLASVQAATTCPAGTQPVVVNSNIYLDSRNSATANPTPVNGYVVDAGDYLVKIISGSWSAWLDDYVDTTHLGGGVARTWIPTVAIASLNNGFTTNSNVPSGNVSFFATAQGAANFGVGQTTLVNVTQAQGNNPNLYIYINDTPITDNRGSVTVELSKCEQVCQNNASLKCVGNSVYWFDSCGKMQGPYQNCSTRQSCEIDRCVNINCFNDSECGLNGTTGGQYCKDGINGNVFQDSVLNKCNLAGTTGSYCSPEVRTTSQTQACTATQNCVFGNCTNSNCKNFAKRITDFINLKGASTCNDGKFDYTLDFNGDGKIDSNDVLAAGTSLLENTKCLQTPADVCCYDNASQKCGSDGKIYQFDSCGKIQPNSVVRTCSDSNGLVGNQTCGNDGKLHQTYRTFSCAQNDTTCTPTLTDISTECAPGLICNTTTNSCTPALAATLSAIPTSAKIGETITLTAVGFGGIGNYTYSWVGLENPCQIQLPNLPNICKTTFSTIGDKDVFVNVASGDKTVLAPAPKIHIDPNCTGSLPKCGTDNKIHNYDSCNNDLGVATDCATSNGLVGNQACQSDGNLHQTYNTYSCTQGQTSCTTTSTDRITNCAPTQNCINNSCVDSVCKQLAIRITALIDNQNPPGSNIVRGDVNSTYNSTFDINNDGFINAQDALLAIASTNTAQCTCTQNVSRKCVGDQIYYFDSCGRQGNKVPPAENCTPNQTCDNVTNSCVCTKNATQKCGNDGKIYQFDSCGNIQPNDVVSTCSDRNGPVGNQTCGTDGRLHQPYNTYSCSAGQTACTATLTDVPTSCNAGMFCDTTTNTCKTPQCTSNASCGTEHAVGGLFCGTNADNNNNIYQKIVTPICNGIGGAGASCVLPVPTKDDLKTTCPNGCLNGTCISPTRILATITLLPATSTLIAGGTVQQITAVTRDQFGDQISATLIWMSSNPSVATVDNNGLVTPLSAGIANITAVSGSIVSTNPAVIIVNSPAPLAPSIDSFTATPSTITSGQSAVLAWTLSGGATTTLSIDNGIGSVLGSFTRTVLPTTTTVYTLTASNTSGTVTRSASVVVNSIRCSNDLDCGTSAYINEPYCQSGNVWQNFKTFTCANKGTTASVCSDSTAPQQKTLCTGQTCTGSACVANTQDLVVSASASPNPALIGQQVTFASSTSGGTGTYAYVWSGACSGSSASCSASFTQIGQQVAVLVVTSGTQQLTRTAAVQVNAQASTITAPSVQTNAATNIVLGQATLNGNALSLGGDATSSTWFQYGTTISYGLETGHQTTTSVGAINQIAYNLVGNTTYHFRAVIQNSVGAPVYGSDMTFLSYQQQAQNNPPTVNAGPDLYVNPGQTVILQGSGYDPAGGGMTFYWTCNGGNVYNPNIAQATFNAPNTNYSGTYTCTLTGTNSVGLSASDSTLVRTNYINNNIAGTVNVQTNPATNLVGTTATLNGYLYGTSSYVYNANTYVWFQWGLTTSYGFETNHQVLSYAGAFSQYISGVTANNIYHFRAVAQDTTGNISYGQDLTFNSQNYTTGGSLIVTKTVRNLSSGNLNLSTFTTAKPNDVLMFTITVQGNSGQNATNVTVRDILPTNLIYNGNLTVDNVTNYGALTSGLNIGNILNGQTRIITYQTQVAPSANFSFGTTTLNNSATVSSNETGMSQPATATVTVTKSGVLGATSVSTGLTNNFWADSFFLPLVLALLGLWAYKSGFLGVDQWVYSRTHRTKSFRAEKKLQATISKIREKEVSKDSGWPTI